MAEEINEPNNGAGSGASGDPIEPKNEPSNGAKTYTQEEVDKMIQSETDRRITSAQKKWQSDFEEKVKAERDEAARFAKLSEDERKNAEFEKEKAEFNKNVKEFEHNKLKLECSNQLIEKGIPANFSDFLTGEDADSTKAKIEDFEKQWKKNLESEVTSKLKGNPPKGGTNEPVDAMLEAIKKGAGLN